MSAIDVVTSAAAAIVTTSIAPTRKSRADTARFTPASSARPSASPATPEKPEWTITPRVIAPGVLPSAIQIPISRVRETTRYETIPYSPDGRQQQGAPGEGHGEDEVEAVRRRGPRREIAEPHQVPDRQGRIPLARRAPEDRCRRLRICRPHGDVYRGPDALEVRQVDPTRR
jgi:hypothetical protein